ncbi:MAG TPA: phosphate regulon sensor histidine kinase PhoR [Alcaligenes sp.]|nr:phosphate regulon sensor histidine kinase PhoR [Alcaligenes sp.]HRL27879.1 phosphate regulon sensor histidine kinase PhoR [Alcaligenes sp.]
MLSTLTSIILWAIFGAIMGWWLGPATGFACLAFGLLIMVLVSGAHVSRIQKWTRNLNDPPPPSIGPWDAILAPVYRQLRRDRQEILDLNRHVDGIMMAAEALPDGAITLNAEMELQWCNQTACEHIGLNLATDRHHSIFNILRAPEFSRYARQLRWDGPLLLHINRDGLEKSLLLQLTPYGLGQFLIVTRDVTQVEKLETTRKDFVANVSHELRTPLTVLLGFLETLQDMPAESLPLEQRQRYEAMMLEQTRHMQSIVADLLTLSTLESSPTVEGETVQVSNLIESALKQGEAISGGQHTFVTNLDPGLAIQGMETELSSAVSNLITNAIRYTPKDGTITVSWYVLDNGDACYSVQDTGIGIAPQDIPRLTERFYRVDKGRSRSTGGTGLGLAITKHIVMRHNAELQIQSRLGVGSLFTLRFPKSRVRILDN